MVSTDKSTAGKGTIILLNGTSSSGKSSIAKSLQEVLDPPYLHTGIDQFLIEHLPSRLIAYQKENQKNSTDGWSVTYQDRNVTGVRIGPLGYQWIAGMYRAIATLAENGLNVIQDDIIFNPLILNLAITNLPTQQVFFVGVKCPLVIAQQREKTRGYLGWRARGAALAFFDQVHAHDNYDLEVDTHLFKPLDCARQIKTALLSSNPFTPRTMTRLRELLPAQTPQAT